MAASSSNDNGRPRVGLSTRADAASGPTDRRLGSGWQVARSFAKIEPEHR